MIFNLIAMALIYSGVSGRKEIGYGMKGTSSLSSEDLKAGNFLSSKEVADIRRRRIEGKAIPDSYYERCHFWINAVRAKEGLPVLKRWTEMESCSNDMSAYDYDQYKNHGRAHAAMIDDVGCDFFASGVKGYAQNSCPLWSDSVDSIEHCTKAMWNEKTDPGVTINGSRMECNSQYDSECGHYYNFRGGRDDYDWYNKYDRVACGFYIDASADHGDALYINQNFGAAGWNQPQQFLCGGDFTTKPSEPLIEDCSNRNNYDACPGELANVDKYACDYINCDHSYTGECVDEHWACSHFTIVPGECGGRYFWTGGDSSTVYYFKNVCRQSCATCACDMAPEPTPAPISQPQPTPNPTNTPNPTPAPTNPTPAPTNPVPAPTNPPVTSPTNPPVPNPTSPPVASPTPPPTNPPSTVAACSSPEPNRLKGPKTRIDNIADACSCATTCTAQGAKAMHYRDDVDRCFCLADPRRKTNGDLDIRVDSRFVYLELDTVA